MNMVYDRDIDAVMERTKHRPLVTGLVSPRAAIVFALCSKVASFVLLTTTVNLLSAILAVSAAAFYIGVYTMWLKRSSAQNIVIGGAAGAVPVLVGWSTVTGRLSVAPFVMFGLIFLWTPPHFWALAVRYREDYCAAHPDAAVNRGHVQGDTPDPLLHRCPRGPLLRHDSGSSPRCGLHRLRRALRRSIHLLHGRSSP